MTFVEVSGPAQGEAMPYLLELPAEAFEPFVLDELPIEVCRLGVRANEVRTPEILLVVPAGEHRADHCAAAHVLCDERIGDLALSRAWSVTEGDGLCMAKVIEERPHNVRMGDPKRPPLILVSVPHRVPARVILKQAVSGRARGLKDTSKIRSQPRVSPSRALSFIGCRGAHSACARGYKPPRAPPTCGMGVAGKIPQ